MPTTAAAPPPGPRFLQLADVAEILNTSSAQVYALVRRGDLKAIKIGGRGQWRVEAPELEKYIERMYADAQRFVDEHPFVEAETRTETMTESAGDNDKGRPGRP
ncbi:MAG: helix-turn-helix domain-containing protein [Marmoricola sp.]